MLQERLLRMQAVSSFARQLDQIGATDDSEDVQDAATHVQADLFLLFSHEKHKVCLPVNPLCCCCYHELHDAATWNFIHISIIFSKSL